MIVIGKFIDFILYLYEECKNINKIDNDILHKLQNDITIYIRQITNINLREICIFFADDFIIKKNNQWKDFLIEKVILKSSSGGGVFFDKFDEYITNIDYEMCFVCLTAMQIGFTGYLDNSTEVYTKYLNKFQKIFYKPAEKIKINAYEYHYSSGNINVSLIVMLLIIVILFPILQKTYYIIEMFNKLNEMYGGLGV